MTTKEYYEAMEEAMKSYNDRVNEIRDKFALDSQRFNIGDTVKLETEEKMVIEKVRVRRYSHSVPQVEYIGHIVNVDGRAERKSKSVFDNQVSNKIA
jgi:hypothetical protein